MWRIFFEVLMSVPYFLLLIHEWLIQLKLKFTYHVLPFKYTCILQGLINLWEYYLFNLWKGENIDKH